MQRLGTALLFTLIIVTAAPVQASDGVVLGIRPDGAVVDISALPNVQPGGRVGFVRPDGQRTPTGQGFVLDVQGGQALIGIIPGGGVQVNDFVVLCPARDSGDGDQVRALVDGIRAQAPSPEVLATASRLQSVLDARNAALQQGNCDIGHFDQETQGLLAQLQSQAAAAQPAGPAVAGYPAPVSGPAGGGYSAPTTAYPAGASTSGYPAGTTTYPAGSGTTGSPASTTMDPATSTQPGYGGGVAAPAGQPGDSIDAASRGADVLAKLALIAQSLGLAKGGTASAGAPPTGGVALPQDAGYPPSGGSGPITGGTYPSPGGSTPAASGGYPASGGSVPPASGGYPSGSGSAASGGYPAAGGSVPPSSGGYPSGSGSASSGGYPSGGYPPAGGGVPTGGSPSGGYPPPGASAPTGGAYPPAGGGYVPPTGGVASGGTAPAAGGTHSGTKPTWTLNQVPRAPLVAIARGTVMGRVQTQTGQPLAAAQVTVGDAKGQTDAQGQFSVAGLAPGQYTVTVLAMGYQKQTRTVTLDPGETERLVVVMPRLVIPLKPLPKMP